ncbi:hypothetical protein H0I23_00435 [Cellulophaga sp. HaHaR_3_176]|uniref:hypothetical protein n=1 Tax=Cellulophaga sp. HaHaR_3_176 TaxID=1942464 RepID=UPI001C1FB604|nr:hypothetical protein [Cellulophaga sp. HaHaR_3_176]QWX84150.1 hypothetical protein H0I23_00435 [Cellulophaga sp. HaHaR_3_176]
MPLEFFGIVTSVRNSKGYLDNNLVTITAHSPTIIADDGPHYHSFIERDLNTIVQNTLSNYDTRKLSTGSDEDGSLYNEILRGNNDFFLI